jgi:hypothetical protein
MEVTKDMKMTDVERLLPKLNDFWGHFILYEPRQNPTLELLSAAEKSWREIEDFEFQKMDIKVSFEQMLKRI